jgi:adenylate cyclase
MFTGDDRQNRDAEAMAEEIERKFLVSEPPSWLADCPSEEIEQGYLAIAEDGDEVRLRRRGDASLLTVKRGHGERREEEEVEIGDEQFEALWPLTDGRRLRKRRHRVEDPAATIEVDVYDDALAGLVTAEVEFPSEELADRFSPPRWLDEELTGDDRYANQRLAVEGRPADA